MSCNASIIDILGAPDMDSCEYLSKHFGTQTIYKASDSDAKDYKGQSSRSEDVMEKSLLSAEDIFAMKKDGECAIVIKGADPLFEPKCKMENTDFVKLLCRKHNPYDPKKRQQARKLGKQGKDAIFVGDDAKKKAKEFREKGTAIVTLTMEDLSNMVMLGEMKQPVSTLKLTEEMQKQLYKNREKYLEEYCDLKELDFEQYREKDGYDGDAQKRFQSRCITVQELDSAGYTRSQIKHLYKLIMADFSSEKIMSMFPRKTTVEQIDNLSKIF